MNLDSYQLFQEIDKEKMYSKIENLPGQLQTAWDLGKRLTLPEMRGLKHIIIAGMGGSAIGADLIASYVSSMSLIPVIVSREYTLPHWAQGPQTLVITSSHSGNTEETRSAYNQAKQNGCNILVISTGGKLAKKALADNYPFWKFEFKGQPRAAVGFSFGLLLSVLHKLGLINNPEQTIDETIIEMLLQQKTMSADIPASRNHAKQLALRIFGKWVVVIGSDCLSPVARRWKGQICEIAKAWAQFEFLPEADHNTLAGLLNPPDIFDKMAAVFIQSPSDHPRNILRSEQTMKEFKLRG
ncbi:MAG: SIS domain-containing protein, partial [Anaerolineaceae bacterium]|nr:SIS domain-containing protein [Anaerolineaceae bacterium]